MNDVKSRFIVKINELPETIEDNQLSKNNSILF